MSRRLELVSMTPEFIEALVAGRRAEAEAMADLKLPPGWPGGDERFLRLRLQQMREDPAVQPWLLRAIVLRAPERTMVGYINFHGRADSGTAAELGYTVMPEFRRRGYATEAAECLMDWASREHGVKRFIVSIGPGNAPSLAMAEKMGFKQTGTQMDEEDGLELVFELSRE